jgi:hypothetical protein
MLVAWMTLQTCAVSWLSDGGGMAARCVATATATATCSECGLAVVFVMAPPLDGARQLSRYGTRYAVRGI